MMGKKKDWTGYRFNTFTVLCENEEWTKLCEEKISRGELKKYNKKYLCQCECGNIVSIFATQIAKGRPLSCGCKPVRTGKDLTGQKFGNWVVLYRAVDEEEKRKSNGVTFHDLWVCQCKCGTVKIVQGSHLRSGKTKSCGCIASELISQAKEKDLAGQRFGNLLVIKRGSKKGHCQKWLCQCKCGNLTEVSMDYLTSGRITECDKCRAEGFSSMKSLAMYKRGLKAIEKDGSLFDVLIHFMSEEDICKIWSVKNKLSPKEITRKSHRTIYLICLECGEEFSTSALSLYSRNHSIICSSCLSKELDSSYEKKIKDYLNRVLKLYTLHEGKCTIKLKNPITKGTLLFDNEIPDLKILIEVHGPQHYKEIKYKNWLGNKTPKEWLEDLQWRDNYKKQKATELGYNYLCISWLDILSGDYTNIIDNFIKGVKQNASTG